MGQCQSGPGEPSESGDPNVLGSHGTELVKDGVYEFWRPEGGQPVDVEIVLLHGLQRGDYKKAYWKTWRMGDDPNTCWPKMLLSEKYRNARILSLCYDSSAQKTAATGNVKLVALAESLLQHMVAPNAMIGQNNCPIIFVCHSLGGLVAKQIALIAGDSKDLLIQKLFNNIKGFFFFGTPHRGSTLVHSWIVHAAKMVAKSSLVVEYLKACNENCADLHDLFVQGKVKNDWKVYIVAEGMKTKLGPLTEWVVKEWSARIEGFGNYIVHTEADHISVCKPKAPEDKGFQHLMKCIKDVGDEHKLNEEEKVFAEENRKVRLLVKDPLGIEDQLMKISEILKSQKSIVGLVGMGGVGKTTLSQALYNSKLEEYKKSSYLENVASKDIKVVQEQLYKDLFPNEKKVVENHLHKIRQCLEKEKVLVVVDDVEAKQETLQNLELLGGMKESKVIVTCRNREVLKEYPLDSSQVSIIEVEGIKDDQRSDWKLFCNYAFHGVEEDVRLIFEKMAEDIVYHCDGLPLSLEVIGKYLYQVNGEEENIPKRMERWKETLQRLREAQTVNGDANDKLWARLRISYEKLEGVEQDLYLAFACLFSEQWRGIEKRRIGWIWNSPNSIQHLINRSLIKVGDDGQTLSMHQQLQDMGQQISREDPTGSKYLWEESKIMSFLKENESSTAVRGLSVNGDKYLSLDKLEDESGDKIMVDESCQAEEALKKNWSKGYSQLRLLHLSDMNSRHVVDYCLFKASEEELRWLCLERSKITEKGLHRIWSFKGLRVLQVSKCLQLEEIPSSLGDLTYLVELEILGCFNLKSLPDAIGHLKQLKRLSIDEAKLSGIPVGVGQLPKLEYLSIANCESLTSMCDFESSMDSLRELYIEWNDDLKTIKGLSNLCSLRILSFSWCTSLGKCDLPGSLEKLSLLETLDLYKCRGLCQEVADALRNGQLHTPHLKVLKLPIIPENLPPRPQLKVLRLDNGLKLNEFPSDLFNNMPGLEELLLWDEDDCLKDLPNSLGNLAKLRVLRLSHFTELVELPEGINQLSQLQRLHLWWCKNLARLPVSLGDLPRLSNLMVYACEKVEWEEPNQRSLREKLESRGCYLSIKNR